MPSRLTRARTVQYNHPIIETFPCQPARETHQHQRQRSPPARLRCPSQIFRHPPTRHDTTRHDTTRHDTSHRASKSVPATETFLPRQKVSTNNDPRPPASCAAPCPPSLRCDERVQPRRSSREEVLWKYPFVLPMEISVRRPAIDASNANAKGTQRAGSQPARE